MKTWVQSSAPNKTRAGACLQPQNPSEGRKEDHEFKFILSKLKTSWVYKRLSPSNTKTQMRNAWPLVDFMTLAMLSDL